jgi:hypothetical protein
VDDGLPIAYEVLERDVPVYASGGEQVGTVDHVVSAPEEDIFHGIVVRTGRSAHLIPADDVESLHERGVHLRIDAGAVEQLEPPHGAAPAWRVREPGMRPGRWTSFLGRMSPGGTRRHDWRDLD